MEISELTVENVTPVIKQIVEEFGEGYVYKEDQRGNGFVSCFYQEDGKPSCIVGHVLDRMGVEYDPSWDEEGGEHAAGILQDAPIKLRRGLQTAQNQQDNGEPWGYALSEYLAVVGQ